MEMFWGAFIVKGSSGVSLGRDGERGVLWNSEDVGGGLVMVEFV